MKNLSDKIARQASPLVLGRLASAALTFVLPLWLARLLDPAGFGTYKQIFLVAQTVLLICQVGLTQSLYYFLPGGAKDRGVYVTQVMLGLGFLSTASALMLFFAGPWIAAHVGDGSIVALRVPLALLAGSLLFAAPLEATLTSEGRVGWAAFSYVVSDALRAAMLLCGALKGGVAGLAWAGAIYGGVRVLALFVLVAAGTIPTGRPSWSRLRTQLAYSLPFAGSVLLYVAQKQFAQYAVSARFDAQTFALYSVAMFHLPVVDIVYSPIAEVLMVRIGQARNQGPAAMRAQWNDAIDKLASVMWPAAACAFLLGPTLLPILFTHKYEGSVTLFLLATIEIPICVLPVDALMRATGETRFLFAWNAVRSVITAVLVIGGMKLFGIGGAIVGGIGSEAVSRAVMLHRGRRALGTTLWGALDLPNLVPIAAATVLATIPAYFAAHWLHGMKRVIAGGAVYGACYLALRLGLHLYGSRARTQPRVVDADERPLELELEPPRVLEKAAAAGQPG